LHHHLDYLSQGLELVSYCDEKLPLQRRVLALGWRTYVLAGLLQEQESLQS
jgi:hypothetical protein